MPLVLVYFEHSQVVLHFKSVHQIRPLMMNCLISLRTVRFRPGQTAEAERGMYTLYCARRWWDPTAERSKAYREQRGLRPRSNRWHRNLRAEYGR